MFNSKKILSTLLIAVSMVSVVGISVGATSINDTKTSETITTYGSCHGWYFDGNALDWLPC